MRLAWPLLRTTWRYLDDGDTWRGHEVNVPLALFSSGAEEEFRWYFEGQSRVLVRSPGEIRDWLLGCAYARDLELFHREDYWQHPVDFESLRRGDCEDHALWAWRKLVELGYDAELVTGRAQWEHEGTPGGHCWVMYRDQGELLLFEAATKRPERMMRPLDEVRSMYEPHASVDGRFVRRLYAGYAKHLKELRDKRLAAKLGRGT